MVVTVFHRWLFFSSPAVSGGGEKKVVELLKRYIFFVLMKCSK